MTGDRCDQKATSLTSTGDEGRGVCAESHARALESRGRDVHARSRESAGLGDEGRGVDAERRLGTAAGDKGGRVRAESRGAADEELAADVERGELQGLGDLLGVELEVGVVGGEEDGVEANVSNDKLFSTPEDGLKTAEKLGLGERGRYLTALTFGNVHGVYKPGNVKLRPSVLLDIQKAVGEKYGKDMPFDLVMHGGSGSTLEEIQEAVDNGVIKMNIDTDTQYAFTRPVVSHMFENYSGVLKVDGEVGNKKTYDPRAWGKKAEAGMAARLVEACENLRSAGTHQG